MNVYDGNRLRSALDALGWTEAGCEEEAGCVIVVTCSIREKAEHKVISELGRYRDEWDETGRPMVALLGCMAQRIGRTVADKYPWVRVVAGPRYLGPVPAAIAASMEGGGVRFYLDEPEQEDPNALDDLACIPSTRSNPHKAYVTIAHGCDQFCSYCIVPHVRGRFGSRNPDDILRELEILAGRGVVEITLLGQNVNTYGKDFGNPGGTGKKAGGYGFPDLLRDAASISGIRRLRFVTSHPVDFGDRLIEAMADLPVVCRSLNLPVQSGSDRILKEMNRKYTRAEYIEKVRRFRSAMPDAGLTTDLIVGFPGEDEDDFQKSVSLIEEVRFDLVHTAAYSMRSGTPAAARTDQIPGAERRRRLNLINEAQKNISHEINETLIGTTAEVLIDEPAPKGEGLMQGRTPADKVVLLQAGHSDIGTIRQAVITGASPWCLEGELL